MKKQMDGEDNSFRKQKIDKKYKRLTKTCWLLCYSCLSVNVSPFDAIATKALKLKQNIPNVVIKTFFF